MPSPNYPILCCPLPYRVDPVFVDKVKRVMNAEVSRNKPKVRFLLGLVGYYRNFVNNFASLTAPLSDLTKNGKPDTVQWSDDLQKRFEEIKVPIV